jgi:hypothetical protein
MDRIGYLKWRKDLYQIQANTAAGLMLEAGCDEESINRVRLAVAKKNIKGNADTQLLEDVTDLVFLEYYILDFVAKHPDYTEEKWIEIIQKTWKKMSSTAQEFALSGSITLPEPLIPVINKAVSSAAGKQG